MSLPKLPVWMTKRFARKAAQVFAVAVALFLGAALTLRWYVTSGRFQKLVEQRAAKAADMKVHMKSLRFSWPLAVLVEGLTLSAPGHEDLPFLTCPQLRVRTSPGDIVRGHIVSLAMVSPKIELVKRDDGFSNIPKLPEQKGERLSIGTITIMNGEFDVDLPAVKANAKGIHATFGRPFLTVGKEKVLRLRTEAAGFMIGRAGQKQIPITLKIIDSKFVLAPNQSFTEVEANIESAITAGIPYLLLPPDIPVRLSLALTYVPQRDALENANLVFKIPLFSKVSAYGSAAGLTSKSPELNLNLTVEAPEIGRLLEYCEPLQRPRYKGAEMKGQLRIAGKISGNAGNPDISVRASAGTGRFAWKGFSLEDLTVDMPIRISAGNVAAGPGIISASKASAPLEGVRVEAAAVSASVLADKSHISMTGFKAKIQQGADLSANGAYEFGSKRFHGNARLDKLTAAKTLALIPPNIFKLPDDVSVGGELDLSCDYDGKITASNDGVSIKYGVTVRGGEISKGEFTSATGINAKLDGRLKRVAVKSPWEFDITGNVGNFEVLIDTFYNAFSDSVFPFSFAGEYAPSAKRFQSATATLDLGRMGKLSAGGDARLGPDAEIEMRVKADKMDLGNLYGNIGEQALSDVFPSLRGAEIAGIASASFGFGLQGKKWTAAGTLDVADGRFKMGAGKLSIDSFSAHLPFDAYFPQGEDHREAVTFVARDFGGIEARGLEIGPAAIPSLRFEAAFKENALRIRGPIPIALFDGKLTVSDISGENLLGSSAVLKTSASVENMNLGLITEKLGLPKVEGTVNAGLPAITMNLDGIETKGGVKIGMFGGAVEASALGIENPFSPVRTFKADVAFKAIDLSLVTETLAFGKITGTMEGMLGGFELSQGQAAAFVADFGTVPRKGVPQKISFDAVQNITILGTGQGFQATLGRGLASFFDEFRYDKMGFHCTLKNDNFRMKGRVVEGGTEYFVKGSVFGPSINVINRNPGQTVSFKSMLERITRVKKKKAESAPSGNP